MADVSIAVGQSAAFAADGLFNPGGTPPGVEQGLTVSWTSSNPAVLSIDGSGTASQATAKALTPGVVTVTATLGALVGTLTVEVFAPSSLRVRRVG